MELGTLPPFDSYGWAEKRYLNTVFSRPLSGYLGGIHKGGYWIERLIEEWQATFRVKYAIPCNSATSGLLAACMAAGIQRGDLVWTTVYSMSATASCAKILGAEVEFFDIEPLRFSINMQNFRGFSLSTQTKPKPKALIVTNLFGHPAYLRELRSWCDFNNITMIEDNAQGIFARIGDQYAGTVGHLGVFSLNVHKHLQCGEGGVVVTNDDHLAENVRDAINHGELRDKGSLGLNLRMTEMVAALACAQLSHGHKIVEGRRELAHELTDMVRDIPAITPPREADNCTSVYYQWAARLDSEGRNRFVRTLNKYGFPMRERYSPLLSEIFPNNSHKEYPVARQMEDRELMTFEVCSYDPTTRQRKIMRELFKVAGETL